MNNGSENFFTRDGSFYVDGAGNLAMTSTGYNVMGWLPDTEDPTTIKQDTVTALPCYDRSQYDLSGTGNQPGNLRRYY